MLFERAPLYQDKASNYIFLCHVSPPFCLIFPLAFCFLLDVKKAFFSLPFFTRMILLWSLPLPCFLWHSVLFHSLFSPQDVYTAHSRCGPTIRLYEGFMKGCCIILLASPNILFPFLMTADWWYSVSFPQWLWALFQTCFIFYKLITFLLLKQLKEKLCWLHLRQKPP